MTLRKFVGLWLSLAWRASAVIGTITVSFWFVACGLFKLLGDNLGVAHAEEIAVCAALVAALAATGLPVWYFVAVDRYRLTFLDSGKRW